MSLLVKDVSKQFGYSQAVDHVNLKVETGSLVGMLGPPGSGKSTLLRLIAGLELPDTGQIWISGQDITYQSTQDREVGFVLQHSSLFKRFTVRENMAFDLQLRKIPQSKVRARIDELLELVQLGGISDRYPSQLTNGQRKRVVLARTLASEPQVLLLDEPFRVLNLRERQELQSWFHHLHNQIRITTIFVTHDEEEARGLSDKIVCMHKGRVKKIGIPAEL